MEGGHSWVPAMGWLDQGLTLLPCKQVLGMWLSGRWRLDMQPLFKSALILDYTVCAWTEHLKKKETRCSTNCGQQGAQPPLPPATSFQMRLRPQPEVKGWMDSRKGMSERRMTWRTGSTPGLHKYRRPRRLRLQASSLLGRGCRILSSLELLRSLRLYSWDGSAVPVGAWWSRQLFLWI